MNLIPIKKAALTTGLSVSRIRQLTDLGVLSASTTPGGHRRYDPDTLAREWRAYRQRHLEPPASTPTDWTWQRSWRMSDDLREDGVWHELRAAVEDDTGPLPSRARQILGYAVTEMVNNAIDHSHGSSVRLDAERRERTMTVVVSDDGVGAFASLAKLTASADPADAVVEITKGKRTTAPDRHSGEGIFFTSKAVDSFELSANGYRVAFDNLGGDVALGSADNDGTVVSLRLDLDTERELVGVFAAYTDDDSGFHRTTPRIELVHVEGDFLSRSEAKRFAAGLERFAHVELDFTDVPLIGQGFADELFRVWQREHPDVRLDVIGANRGVQLMIDRIER